MHTTHLYSISCTQTCQSKHENKTIMKFADSVIVSLLHDHESSHGPVIEFVTWYDESFLELNIPKTKDVIIDFRTQAPIYETVIIKDQAADCVESSKYLGTVIDSELTFGKSCEVVCKKAHQHLFCLRHLSHFHTDKTTMTLFYCTFIESILSFSLVSRLGNLSLKNKNSPNQIVKRASKLIGESQLHLSVLYSSQLQRKASSVLQDCSHPSQSKLQFLRSSWQFVAPTWRTKRYCCYWTTKQS